MPRARGCVGILFILSLIAGILLGYICIGSDACLGTASTITPSPPPPPPSNSILVLGVDSLELPNPGLEGAWIITMPSTNNQDGQEIHFEIFTMYPVSQAKVLSPELSQFTQPHPRIILDPSNPFSPVPLAPLGINPDGWIGTILLDEYIINLLLLLQNNPNILQTITPPPDDLFIKPWLDPPGALEQQKAILTTLCEHPQPLANPNVIAAILQMEHTHIKSNLGESGLLRLWQNINYSYSKQVSCDLFD
jgi:hypothetical protein